MEKQNDEKSEQTARKCRPPQLPKKKREAQAPQTQESRTRLQGENHYKKRGTRGITRDRRNAGGHAEQKERLIITWKKPRLGKGGGSKGGTLGPEKTANIPDHDEGRSRI